MTDTTPARGALDPRPRGEFTLRQLECFVATAEAGSIAQAAVALHASESAIADALSALGASWAHRSCFAGAPRASR